MITSVEAASISGREDAAGVVEEEDEEDEDDLVVVVAGGEGGGSMSCSGRKWLERNDWTSLFATFKVLVLL